jgi:hypothetical protein
MRTVHVKLELICRNKITNHRSSNCTFLRPFLQATTCYFLPLNAKYTNILIHVI